MKTISVLDKDTIDKIAAGEVIERPASIVKELVENAIDAGANAVTVEIKDGGISLVRITDNGEGIEPSEVRKAFLRHATSKIKSAEDLTGITSLGFRGEALSSIAAVCQVELITKTAGNLTGVRYQIDGGEEKTEEPEEIGAPEGTTFKVRNLFFNTPVRRKFLKSPQTEAGYINDLIERLALSHPEVSFKFINNNQNKLHTSGNTNLKDIIYNIYGREITANLIAVEKETSLGKVSGFIGKPVISRGNRNYENYFINGRYVRSSIIAKAIEDAYKNFMMQHKYPFTVLHFDLNGENLDVNVHPTKMELRFSDPEAMYRMAYEAVRDALTHREMIPDVGFDQKKEEKKEPGIPKSIPEPFEVHRRAEVSKVREEQEYHTSLPEPKPLLNRYPDEGGFARNLYDVKEVLPQRTTQERDLKAEETAWKEAGKNPALKLHPDKPKEEPEQEPEHQAKTPEMKPEQMELFEDKLLSRENVKEHRIIGQLFETYWLVEFRDKLYIIDQHAAHEKVLFERTMKSLENKEYTSQQISPPMIVTLSMQEQALLETYMENFTRIGFEIEPFGGDEYSIRAVPGNLFGLQEKEVFLEMLDGLASQTGRLSGDMINEKIASMSCKAAVKGNHRLSRAEAEALIDELLTLENPYNCPHGRPTIISMSKYELEKKFKRVVS